MACPASPAGLEIKPRDLHIDREALTPRWWMNGDPVATAVINALSLTFPDGERFFIQSIKRFAKGAPPRLAADIRAFTVQEGAHTREHLAFNAITERAGYDTTAALVFIDRVLEIARGRSHLEQLAATVALEHYTASFSHQALADPDFFKGAPDDLARLWRWHCVEEIEHKGVAYDVFLNATQGMSGWARWRLRTTTMVLTTLDFTKTVRTTSLMLLAQDGIKGWKAHLRLFRWLWLRPGLYRRMVLDYLAFYRPGFHPWQVDDRDLIADAEGLLAYA